MAPAWSASPTKACLTLSRCFHPTANSSFSVLTAEIMAPATPTYSWQIGLTDAG